MTWLLAAAYNYDWDIIFRSLFAPDGLIVHGIIVTVSVAVVSQFLGVVLGVFAALARLSRYAVLRVIARVYIWFFRGTPLLVQIAFLYYGLGVTGIYKFPDFDINGFVLEGAIQAGIIALAVNEGAYMSEIVRAGILSIDRGQMEAAKSLGMTYPLAMRRIVLPQAARVIIPPLGNEFNNMLKSTSLLTIISVRDIFGVFEDKNGSGSTSFHTFELYIAAALWYLILTTLWGFVQGWIERRFGKGTGGESEAGVSLRARLFGFRTGVPAGIGVGGLGR